jgi:hypothetical protein
MLNIANAVANAKAKQPEGAIVTVYQHHCDAIAVIQAIGNLPYQVVERAEEPLHDVQYLVLLDDDDESSTNYPVGRRVTFSIIRFNAGGIDYSDKANYEIATMMNDVMVAGSVQQGLDISSVEKHLHDTAELYKGYARVRCTPISDSEKHGAAYASSQEKQLKEGK